MHHKKSEAQVIKESRVVSSGFNPTPQNQLQKHQTPKTAHFSKSHEQHQRHNNNNSNDHHCFTMPPPPPPPPPQQQQQQRNRPTTLSDALTRLRRSRSTHLEIVRHFRCAHLVRLHFRLLILLSLPSLYFAVSNPRRSLLLDFLTLSCFSLALLISLNLALPRLLSIHRLFHGEPASDPRARSPPEPPTAAPVLWSIGSKPRPESRPGSGSWVKIYDNGDVYEGEFHKGRCSGSGVYYYSASGRYEGDWVDEKYDGFGVEMWARGSRYRGQYRQGLRHGVGVYRFFTGDVYGGEWASGQCHGCGVHTCEDGSKYVGEFKWGVKHGLGHYHFRNGDTYAGEYFADKMHGFGVYWFANGHRYEGAWHEGRRQGLGMYTFRNGEIQSGHWQNGFLDVSSVQSTLPESPRLVSHARVLNTVQEAQRAAERAQNIATVDERVNRTIGAANKAATAARVAAVKAVQNQMDRDKGFESPFQYV